MGCKDIGIGKSEFVANTQFLFTISMCSYKSKFIFINVFQPIIQLKQVMNTVCIKTINSKNIKVLVSLLIEIKFIFKKQNNLQWILNIFYLLSLKWLEIVSDFIK